MEHNFDTDYTPEEEEPSFRPWYQRWFGDIFPSEKTVNHTTEGFAYIVAFILGVSIRLGIGFGAGYALGILIGWEPLYAGAIGMCVMLFIGGRE